MRTPTAKMAGLSQRNKANDAANSNCEAKKMRGMSTLTCHFEVAWWQPIAPRQGGGQVQTAEGGGRPP